jgi:fructosamine-3-kinase
MQWREWSQVLSEAMQSNLTVEGATRLSGGDIHQAFQLHTDAGDYFLKLNRSASLPLLETEAHSLNAIAHSNSLRCPKPLQWGLHHDQAWLLVEFLPLTAQGDDFLRGQHLALMHRTVNSDPQPFGWFEHNYIGHTLQPNAWHSDWIEFYAEQRLRPQLELAQLRGAKRSLFDLGMHLLKALPFWFQRYRPEASLLHGDLWGGNSAFTAQGDPVIYDPASYYGDRETDIAMTELFGGFSDDFYRGYNRMFPLDEGYASRKPLYNLYHILNHFNLFGGHYGQQAETVIRTLLKQVDR